MNMLSNQPMESEKKTTANPTVTIHPPRLGMGTLLLIISVLLSGLAMIYLADLNRRLAINAEEVTTQQNQLHMEWGKLLLEQSTWSTQARIQQIAAQQFNMQSPNSNQIVMIKISKSSPHS